MRTHAANELVIDLTIYPRWQVDQEHIFGMVEALKVGVKLPPVVIDKATKKIVDGVHRVKAYQEYEGAAAEVECIEKSYKDPQDLFLDAIKYNAAHGRNLTRNDRTRIVELGVALGIDEERLAGTMHVSEQYLGVLKAGGVTGALVGANRQAPASDRVQKWERSPTSNDGTYALETERIKRAHEIVERVDFESAEMNDAVGFLEACWALRDLLNQKCPTEEEIEV